jgi:hypothetical protein
MSSNELYNKKRKVLQPLFYRDKMNIMFKNIVKMTDLKVKEWLVKYKDQPLELFSELTNHITNCM